MTEHADGPGSQIDHDAMNAWSFALNLDGASPERRAATLKTVLELFDSDASRIERAAASCQARRDSDADDIWGAAADLLEQGLAQMRAAGATQDEAGRARFAEQLHQELHPQPQPYTWPDRHDPRRNWPRRLVQHTRLRWQHTRPRSAEAGPQLLLLHLGGTTIGKLDYQVYVECHRGYVRRLDVDDRYRGLGLGARAIHAVRRRHRGLQWRTTPHYLTAGTFWPKAAGHGGGFQADAEWPCQHMRDTR